MRSFFSGVMTGRRLMSLFLYLILGAGAVYFLTETSLYQSTRITGTALLHPMRSLQIDNVTYTEQSIRAIIKASINSSHILSILGKTVQSAVNSQRQTSGQEVKPEGQSNTSGAKIEGQDTKSQNRTVNTTSDAVISNTTSIGIKDTKDEKTIRTTTFVVKPTTQRPVLEGSTGDTCPETPPKLVGKWVPRMDIVNWTTLEGKHPELSAGGRWKPTECKARHRVAILIAYRSRSEHLHIFMNNMHDFLQRQQLDYGIYVVEQGGKAIFNRAMLFNVGFTESLKDYDWQCHVLHDVDHIPLNDKNLYTCPERPRHLSAAIQKWGFKQPYSNFFGGVSMMKAEHYKKINGMSNKYWGWGGEDDDFYYRCSGKGLVPIMRYPPNIANYVTVQRFHQRAPSNNARMKLLGAWRKRQDTDGLSDLKYTVLKKEQKKLYTHLVVNLGRMARR